mmetsp:Transcript_38548/g.46601  ORF Transcript_38548/g.46601 Transcript_38548/m.46601 type:complete len:98 (-) Transcript_38548:368-661(-)|eukprot:CAMPEP_0197863518 /NCGR_PEP_ID=MMETSP1438-20131217/41023_1 /TAXON_ID=1461541 /ORGANISM="Pterosperma sp., Strain CCMP1384" /LENGTH=97 /DNA_ID=CAMNT_0043481445 /DNA_START=186 /DNA_END=479 /DNA_ORIENTATION=-
MAYNLYQVQMAMAWKERVEKENAQADKANAEAAMARAGMAVDGSVASMPMSQATKGSNRSYSTQVLKSRLDELERELGEERKLREKVELDLATLKET